MQSEIIKNDFNEIALIDEKNKWNHNNCYYKSLIKLIPENAVNCLEIGCGKGDLSVLLSKKCRNVIAVDFAENMIAYAKNSNSRKNISYICADILDFNFSDMTFDVIISVATVHHLPDDWIFEFALRKLNKGGKLIILDIPRSDSIPEKIFWGFAVIPNFFVSSLKKRSFSGSDKLTKIAWDNHGQHDSYHSVREIKEIALNTLPEIQLKRKLFWRYLLVWKK